MAWYYGTYSCHHDGRTNIVGPTKNREWIKERHFSGLCPECYKEKLEKDKEEKNSAAKAQADEMELPELSGTEKQIQWANTLRIEFLERAESLKGDQSKIAQATDFIIKNKTKASWFIDNRNLDLHEFMNLYSNLYNELPTEQQEVEQETMEILKKEAVVKPENVKHLGIVEISIKANKIVAIYEKNDDFRSIVKSLGYTWERQWEKAISETTGSAEDRAAELGNHLLNAGFAVSILDDEIRMNAINGNYEPECKRWIYHRKDTKKLALNWPKGEPEKIYNGARRIPTARWDNPSVLVNVSHYEEVEDFADVYGFQFTKAARNLIEKYKEEISSIKETDVKAIAEIENIDRLEKILKSSDAIISDLMDGD